MFAELHTFSFETGRAQLPTRAMGGVGLPSLTLAFSKILSEIVAAIKIDASQSDGEISCLRRLAATDSSRNSREFLSLIRCMRA